MSNNNSRHDYLCKRLRRTKADWQNPEQELLNHAADALEKLEADNAALLTKVRQCLTMTRSEAQLLAGEMTAGEWRTVSAILVNRIKVIDAMREGKHEST